MMRFQRRQRTTFSKHQLEAMKAAFEENHYPEANLRDELSKRIDLDPMRIQVWFQNQRAKNRKRNGGAMDDGSLSSPPPPQHQRQHQINHESQVQLIQDQRQLQQPHLLGYHHRVSSVPLRPDGHQRVSCFQRQDDKQNDREPSPDQRPRPVCVFNSATANEAALAVSEGEFVSIVDYHRNKYGNHQQQVVFLNSRHKRQCISRSSTTSPQSTRSPPSPSDPTNTQLSPLQPPSSSSRQLAASAYHQVQQEQSIPHSLIDNNNNNNKRSLYHAHNARMVPNI